MHIVGATDAELTQMEQQKQNGINKNIERDWNSFYSLIGAANSVICNIDSVPDASLTQLKENNGNRKL